MNLLWEVKEKVGRPFDEKLQETRGLIADHFEEFGARMAVAFSGGKDSEIVLYLCRQVKPDVPVIFNNTGVEYPETLAFIQKLHRDWNLNLITTTKPEKNFWQCMKECQLLSAKADSFSLPRGRDFRGC